MLQNCSYLGANTSATISRCNRHPVLQYEGRVLKYNREVCMVQVGSNPVCAQQGIISYLLRLWTEMCVVLSTKSDFVSDFRR